MILRSNQWARLARIPVRGDEAHYLDGEQVTRILGIEAKSWDPVLFADMDLIVSLAEEALASAEKASRAVDLLIVASCTPYELMLDQDALKLARRIGLCDEIVAVQMGTGCGGLARAFTLIGTTDARTALVITYTVPSLASGDGHGGVGDLYRRSTGPHPDSARLWCSPGTFSDGAGAVVLERDPTGPGVTLYSRDTDHFAENSLVRYPGGGLNHPPGTLDAERLSCYGLDGTALAEFYPAAMKLNHDDLERALPGYLGRIRRLYTHQASPALVAAYHESAGLDPDLAPTNARELGNLVTASTLQLLHRDLDTGKLARGDLVCFSVVGAGPERGAFLLAVDVPSPTEPRVGQPSCPATDTDRAAGGAP